MSGTYIPIRLPLLLDFMNLCNFINLHHLMQGTKGTLVLLIMTEMNVATHNQAYPLQGEIIMMTPLVKMKGEVTTTVPLTHHLVSGYVYSHNNEI